jgi:integrase
VTGAEVAGLLRGLRARGLSEATLANALRVVRAIYRLARVRKVVTRSPVDELDPSELPRPRPARNQRRLDEQELEALVRHVPQTYRVPIALLAYTRARVSEVLALCWRHVSFVDLELRVEQQLTRATREKPARFAPRKGDAPPYAAVIFPALEQVLVEQLASDQAAGRGGEDDLLVATRAGRPLIQRNLARAVEDAGTAAGLGHVTPHVLRRSFASLAARRGVDPVQAARMTGHSLGTWTRFYANDYGKAQRDEARQRMLDAGFGAVPWQQPR